MDAFWLSMGMVFVAELGDKTQLVALCLASRFRAMTVLAGIFCATLVVHIVSVVLGCGVGRLVPAAWVALTSGIAFIGFGFWTLRGDSLSDDECANIRGRSAFWLVFTTFFLAELGDKTMLSTVTLAASHSMIPVWLGSSLGMVISDGLAIIVGQVLGAKLPERAVKIGAAVIFFGFGLWSGVGGALKLPFYATLIGASLVVLMVLWYLRAVRAQTRKAAAIAVTEPEEAYALVTASAGQPSQTD